jgi:hypothetical protein
MLSVLDDQKGRLSSNMTTEWGELSSGAASNGTAPYVRKYNEITSTQLCFLCRRLLLLIDDHPAFHYPSISSHPVVPAAP